MEEVELYRGPLRRRCREFALVLQSRGVPSRQVQEAGDWVLLVSEVYAAVANRELTSYCDENSRGGERSDLIWSPRAGRLEAAAFAVLCAVFYAAQSRGYFGLDWLSEGRVDGRLGVGGNLERALTSLTLHADLRHVLSNILYGCLFGLLLSQAVGAGVAWLGIVLSGFLGNLLSVWLSPPHISSIGASTMVFGALGMLAAYQWRVRKRANLGLKQWAPLVAGTLLLGFFGFGTSGNINYMAHLTGFFSGVVLGALLGGWRPLLFSVRLQRSLLLSALGLLILAWSWAFAW